MRNRKCTGLAGRGGKVGAGLETAKEVRLRKDHGGGIDCCGRDRGRVGRSIRVRDLDDFQPEPRGKRLHDSPRLRIQRLCKNDLRAASRLFGEETRVGRDRVPVVAGRVRDVQLGQLADCGLVLEDRLENALTHLRLVGRVRSQQLPALEYGVDDGGYVVVVDACAEEAQLPVDIDIARRELGKVRHELGLGQRGLEIELTFEPHRARDLSEQIVDACRTDRLEHRLTIVGGEREKAHSAITAQRPKCGSSQRREAGRARLWRRVGCG